MSAPAILRLATLVCLLAFAPSLSAKIVRVKGDARGLNTGSSWMNAYVELVSAINAAQPGDEIWIARGTYYPDFDPVTGLHDGDRGRRFLFRSGVKYFGGFAGTETSRAGRNIAGNRTILSGDVGVRGDFSDNTQTVCWAADASEPILVEGLVIAGGNASRPELGNMNIGGSGGGVHIQNSSVEFRTCAIVGNYATYGGGILYRGGSDRQLTLVNCALGGNTAVYVGAAVQFQAEAGEFTVIHCTLMRNRLLEDGRACVLGTSLFGTCRYFNNLIFDNNGNGPDVEMGNGAPVTEGNILQKPFPQPGTGNLVVADERTTRPIAPGNDLNWGTVDDILDGKLHADSPAVGFASATRLPADSTDLDGDGNTTEPLPRDGDGQPRVAGSAPDAGAFERTDAVTFSPRMDTPTSNLATKSPVLVYFYLEEDAAPGTLRMTVYNAEETYFVTFPWHEEDAGFHPFGFFPGNPDYETPPAGRPIPDGVYHMRLSYQDKELSPVAELTVFDVRIDTKGPTSGTMTIDPPDRVLLPGTMAAAVFTGWTDASDPAPLSYRLAIDDALLPGTLTQPRYDFQVPGEPGEHTFEGRIIDVLGNETAIETTRYVAGPPLATTLPPDDITPASATLHATVHPRGLTTKATFFVDGVPAGEVTVPPGEAEVEITLPVSSLAPFTAYVVEAKVENSEGEATGGEVTFLTSVSEPTHRLAVASGTVVSGPAATALPPGTTWRRFGVPTLLGDGREVGFAAQVALRPGTSSAAVAQGIFSGPIDAPVLRVSTGTPAFDAYASPLSHTTFASFLDPVFATPEHWAVIAQVAGRGVTTANDSGIWAGHAGKIYAVAREGNPASGGPTATFKEFVSVLQLEPGRLYFTAKLAGVPAAQAFTLWTWTPEDKLELVQQSGAKFSFPGAPATLKSFKALHEVAGSPGHGRHEGPRFGLLGVFPSGAKGIFNIEPTGFLDGIVAPVDADTGAVANAFGPPSWRPGTNSYVAAAQLTGGDLPAGAKVPAVLHDGSVIAWAGMPIPGGDAGVFASFQNPIAGVGRGGEIYDAFPATLSGVAAQFARGLWRFNGSPAVLSEIARSGSDAAGLSGPKWRSFTSLSVMSGRGAIFTATLGGPVTPASDAGFWAEDHNGIVRLVFREGDVVAGKLLRSFSILGVVPGSPGQRRAWREGTPVPVIAWRATFSDGSTAILTTALP